MAPVAPIRKLSLAFSNGPKDLLLALLLRHAGTLRTLRLFTSALRSEDDWTEVFDVLASNFQLEELSGFDLCFPNTIAKTHTFHYQNETNFELSAEEQFPQNMSSLRESGCFVSVLEDSEADDE
ncbi:hypothetical protein CLAFUW4_07091 [Fulvia fulva]|uniref:Uncharacterized protein n=1 Tax=Passalora fulva TaxID=5499 RepID=A0A9Q8PB24_PASFU|nr:uncharacterized protein CLAFUR5_07227 [Fulvia fulva]KAK4622006.1 hypothetical protein CLAFUR4_07100 [Fulvia fulva]KAK4622934.1 hypothetical protein CLAFUR0_07098 [Fulvia fulva]UJO19203.1 hypothetical protein CLAFUR5_07227 [Fulvia fulva]WPV16065.1 hypothetical protein CLAFUW4_07091 [Fulvia fulva]WPV31446.1 hypothetical protein CLAFUW7_07091 [Fulvia fulva]